MERRAHQAGLDEPALLEGPCHLRGVEALEPRPQGEVRGGGLLRLEPADRRRRIDDVEPAPVEQVLAREGRPVQRVARQDGSVGSEGKRRVSGIGRTSQTNTIAISPTTTATIVVARIDR